MLPPVPFQYFKPPGNRRRINPEKILLRRRRVAGDKQRQTGQLHKDRGGIRPLRQKQTSDGAETCPKRFLTVRENDTVLRPLVAASTTALHNDRAIVDVICVVRSASTAAPISAAFTLCGLLERCDFSSDSEARRTVRFCCDKGRRLIDQGFVLHIAEADRSW